MIRLRVLGGVELTGADGRVLQSVLQQPRRMALLVYLALAGRDRIHRRDKLLALFWPESDEEHARGSLSQALYMLRRTLGRETIVSRGADEVGLAQGVWCDATEFEAALAAGRLAEGVALYRGDLLDGFFIEHAPAWEHWLQTERERLRRGASEACLRYAEELAATDANAEAAGLIRRSLTLLPADEGLLRRVVGLLARSGDRAGAVQAYESFAARLRDEYELDPSAETRALLAQVRAADPDVARVDSILGAAPREPTPHEAAPHEGTFRGVAPPDGTPRRSLRPRMWPWHAKALIALSCLLAAGLARHVLREPEPASPAVEEVPSIAVLPFVDLGAEPEGEYFTDGLTEEILNSLARVDGLRVAARTSAFAFKGRERDVREIGRQLAVGYVLEGSVRKEGDRLKVSSQLIDARTGYLVWSDSYDRRLAGIFSIQEDISRAIVAAVGPRLVIPPERGLSVRPTDVRAYSAYLKGKYHFNRRTRDDAHRAAELFEGAIALDSTFALAWAGLADALALLPYLGVTPAKEILPRAEAAAREAAKLDPGLAAPHSTLGWIGFTYLWDWEAAEREFEEALRLNPSYPDALHFYSLYLARVKGDSARARELASRAQLVDPLAPVMHAGAGAVFYHIGDFEASVAAHQHALAIDSAYWIARALLAKTLLAAGRPGEALVQLRMIPPGESVIHRTPAVIGVAHALLGQREEAAWRLAEAQRLDVRPYEVAILHTAMGDYEGAFEALERAVDVRDPGIVNLLNEPLLAALKSDRRIYELAERVGLGHGEGPFRRFRNLEPTRTGRPRNG